MINFKELITTIGDERLQHTVTIGGHPVWDYKANEYTVYLISEDPWQGVEEEYVTLAELRKYIVTCRIPFDVVMFATESDRELLKRYEWGEKQLDLYY